MAGDACGNALSAVVNGMPRRGCRLQAQCEDSSWITVAPVSRLLANPCPLLPTFPPLPPVLPLQIAKECRAAGKAVFVESLVSLRLLL